tara:strand:- start:1234 stop:1914 length:681 start_codon:yes stop_codon:yes gene_type:complete
MASKKYAYFNKGNKLALIQQQTSNMVSNDYLEYKSPNESVDSGLEIEYAYSPHYIINDVAKLDQNITHYRSNGGLLEISDRTSTYTNYGNMSGDNITDGSYIVLRDANEFAGLHQTNTKSDDNGTNDVIQLKTKYYGSSTWTAFNTSPKLYYSISALLDESFDLDISRTQAQAIVYYVKARLSEDTGNLELKEYFMREFKKLIERSMASKHGGAKFVQGFNIISRR